MISKICNVMVRCCGELPRDYVGFIFKEQYFRTTTMNWSMCARLSPMLFKDN